MRSFLRRMKGRAALTGGLTVLLATTLVCAAGATLPRGELRLWVEQRYERWGPYGVVREQAGTLYHVDAELLPVNRGLWSLWLDAADGAEQVRVEARDMPSTLGRVSMRLGDHTAQGSGLFPLRAEFQNPVWIRGATLGVRRGDVEVQARGGALTRREGLVGQGRSSIGAEALGFGVSGSWGERGIWELSWDRQEEISPASPASQLARVTLGARAPRGWSWLGEMRVSGDGGGDHRGTGYLGGATFTGARFSLGGHLRRVSREFQGLGLYQTPIRNQWGGRLETSVRFAPRTLVGAAADWSRDLERDEMGRAPEERLSARTFVSSGLIGPLYLTGHSAYRTRTTVDPDSLLVDQGTFSGGGELGWRRPRGGGGIGYTRGLFRDPVGEVGDWHEDRYRVHAFRALVRSLQAQAEASVAERRLPDGTWTSRERRAELRLGVELSRHESLWLSAAREYQEAASEQYRRDQWQLGLGWMRPLFWDLTLRVEGLAYLPAGEIEPESARWNLRVSRSFRLGGGRPGHQEGPLEFATVSGMVFEDADANGRRDRGERGLEGIVLRLGSGAETVTGPDGAYAFATVSTQLDFVTLDLARLPARYLAPEDTRIPVALGPGQRRELHFAVCPAAAVHGRVVIREADGTLTGVPDVLVSIRDSHHDMFTDEEGRFFISGLGPGAVTLEVVGWSLPERTRLAGPASMDLRLTPGQVVEGGSFRLERVGSPVQQRFRSGSR